MDDFRSACTDIRNVAEDPRWVGYGDGLVMICELVVWLCMRYGVCVCVRERGGMQPLSAFV